MNPIFHQALFEATDGNPLQLSYHFSDDVDLVLKNLLLKANPASAGLSADLGKVLLELDRYLRKPLPDGFETLAVTLLASDFWTNGTVVAKFPNLAPLAARITAAPSVSSQVERLFSRVGDTWSSKRNSLSVKRASLFSSANYHLEAKPKTESEEEKRRIQERLLKFVQKIESTQESIPEIKEKGIGELDEFLERFLESSGFIYGTEPATQIEGGPIGASETQQVQGNVPNSEARRDTTSPSTTTTSTSSTQIQVESTHNTLLGDLERAQQNAEASALRRSKRDRKPTPKMALAQTEFLSSFIFR